MEEGKSAVYQLIFSFLRPALTEHLFVGEIFAIETFGTTGKGNSKFNSLYGPYNGPF